MSTEQVLAFVYRSPEDLRGLEEHSRGAACAAVIGRGPRGLEAASSDVVLGDAPISDDGQSVSK